MAHWVNKNQWQNAFSPGDGRRVGKTQFGSQSNRVAPTAYSAYGAKFSRFTPTQPNGAPGNDVDAPNLVFFNAFFGSVFSAARNNAWSSFVENVRSDPASLGINIAEMEKSLSMITRRAAQCYQGYHMLRKGNFRYFLRTFGIKAKRKHKNLVKSQVDQASSLWLEYSYGWKPAFQDIWDAGNAMGQPVPGGMCWGQGKESYSVDHYACTFSTSVRCRQGAFVSVSNPNLYLLQQLGVANPAVVAWEVVPFSFVIDWVFDVGTFLGALTDLLGCQVSRASQLFPPKLPCYAKATPHQGCTG